MKPEMAPELASFRLEAYTADSSRLDDAVRVYVETWGRDWDSSHSFFARYARLPGFRGLVAVLGDGRVVGCGFGTRSLPGHWWHDRVAAEIGADHPALQDAWVLTELAVLAPYRRRGVGGLLLEGLVAVQPGANLLLSTLQDSLVARRFYERHGWSYLAEDVVFRLGEPTYAVMRNVVA